MDLRTAAGYLRATVIYPTLRAIGLCSPQAAELLLGTAAVESGGLREIRQRGNGPALSLWQIELTAHSDVWVHYLARRPALRGKIYRIGLLYYAPLRMPPSQKTAEDLEPMLLFDHKYACAIARIIYRRAPEPLPTVGDFEGQAALWKLRYNTVKGKGDPAKYVRLMKEIYQR